MNLNEVKKEVIRAARDCMPLFAIAKLLQHPKSVQKEIANSVTEMKDGQQMTPLITAARYGLDRLVRYLLYQVEHDLEVEGVVEADDKLVEGATALWCAAAFGHLSIVKMLVKFGACVNHCTKSKSTALRAACWGNCYDIASYLIAKGADVNIANDMNNTMLMLVTAKGYYHLASLLIDSDVDINARSIRGSNALHFAAQYGKKNLIELLFNNQTEYVMNEYNMTPILVAAEKALGETVRFISEKHKSITLHETIEAYELLGASYANSCKNFSRNSAILYLSLAMNMRMNNDDNVIIKKKNLLPPIDDYQNHCESENFVDLRRLDYDDDKLYMEGLVIRERILGSNNSILTPALVYRGAFYADNYMFDNCLKLWLRAMKINLLNNEHIDRDLLRFAQVFSQMMVNSFSIPFNYFHQVIDSIYIELQRCNERLQKATGLTNKNDFKSDLETNLLSALYIINIFTKITLWFSSSENMAIETVIFQIIKLDYRMRDGQSLLHLAVSQKTFVDNMHTNQICMFPCYKTTKLLLKCGADVNSLTLNRLTPINNLWKSSRFHGDNHILIACLKKWNAHIDICDNEGFSPVDDHFFHEFNMIFRLECLAARSVARNKVLYRGLVSKDLQKFIDLHGPRPEN